MIHSSRQNPNQESEKSGIKNTESSNQESTNQGCQTAISAICGEQLPPTLDRTRNENRFRLDRAAVLTLKHSTTGRAGDEISRSGQPSHAPNERKEDAVNATVNLQLSVEAESDPKRQFKMIDAWLREYERRNRDWPTLAKLCHEVKVKGLWKHGGYKDWNHWVLAAAPVCGKTVFVYVGMYENLAPDFSHQELQEMPPETAKKMTQVSSARRQDPAIREASKKRRREFVQTVKAVAPEQHIEDDIRKTFTFSESQWAVIEQTFREFRQDLDAPNMSDEEIIEALCINWSQGVVRDDRSLA